MKNSAIIPEIVESINKSNSVLIAVSNNPNVDSLSAALGLAVILNKMDKHATAVFSGVVPPAITFLHPEKTFEPSPNSLRDFIISLDKEKADHLRYKIEGDYVRIFITPYRANITKDDLQFSEGDFNVDLVITIGVTDQKNLDGALEAHGRILHDSLVISLSTGDVASSLGTIDWHEPTASSLSEMVEALYQGLDKEKKILDKQIATALLTGIVASTERFSNLHTTSESMTAAARLIAAGANQQLIAAKLATDHPTVANGSVETPVAVAPDPIQTPATAEEVKPTDVGTEPVIQVQPEISIPHQEPAVATTSSPETDLAQGLKTIQPLGLHSSYASSVNLEAELQKEAMIPPVVENTQSVAAPTVSSAKTLVNEDVPASSAGTVNSGLIDNSITHPSMNSAMQGEDDSEPNDIFAQNTKPFSGFVDHQSSTPLTPEPSLPLPPPLPDFSNTTPVAPPSINSAYAVEPPAAVENLAPENNGNSQFRIPGAPL